MKRSLQSGIVHLKDRTEQQAQSALPTLWQPVDWIQEHFFVYDTEEPLYLYPSQSEPLTEALRRDNLGRFIYDLVLWSWMKKAAKSTIIAAVADFVCIHKPKASVKLVAHDLKQADTRIGYYLRENILLAQRLTASGDTQEMRDYRNKIQIKNRGLYIEYPNGSRVECVPVDPRGEAGGNDDMIVFSELWGWRTDGHQKMWSEMTIAAQRFGYAQRWVDTYAGYIGDSPILEQLYDEIVVNGEQTPLPNNSECYVRGRQFATWVTTHHLPWQTEEYLESERATLSEEQFERMHMNRWAHAVNAFVPIEWWDECADSEIPAVAKYEEIVIALDAAVDSDCFAMVGVGRDRRKRSKEDLETESPDYLIKRYARQWTPPKDGKLKFYSSDPDEITPASELRRLIKGYNIIQIAYDPYQLEHFVAEMEEETGAWFEPFGQQVEREISDKALYDMIRAGRIVHDGTKDDLREHILNSASKTMSDDRRLRIVKRQAKKKIDLCVALSMAAHRACQLIAK